MAALFAVSVMASAKGGFGVTAGLDFNSVRVQDIKTDAKVGWNAGVVYSFDFPLGFSLQPSILYTQKSAALGVSSLTHTMGSVTVPVSVQWGPNLLVARPFVDVTPYVGYSISNKVKGEAFGLSAEEKGKNAFDYGLGVGAGLDVWKLQVIVRYNWNFGVLGSLKDFADLDLDDFNTDNETFGGISVHLAIFF